MAEGGTLYWVTARGVLFSPRANKTHADLRENRLHAVAAIDVAPGAFPGTMIEGVLIVLSRKVLDKKLVGALRDLETAELMASDFVAGPSRKDGPSWTWLDADDKRTFTDVEHARLLKNLMPRGRQTALPLGSILTSENVEKSDKPVPDRDQATAFLFVPEYAGSRVTAGLEEQTVKARAVYRLQVDPARANPRFLAHLFNRSARQKGNRALAEDLAFVFRGDYRCDCLEGLELGGSVSRDGTRP